MFCPRCKEKGKEIRMKLRASGCTYEVMSCPQCGYREEEDTMDVEKIFKEA